MKASKIDPEVAVIVPNPENELNIELFFGETEKECLHKRMAAMNFETFEEYLSYIVESDLTERLKEEVLLAAA